MRMPTLASRSAPEAWPGAVGFFLPLRGASRGPAGALVLGGYCHHGWRPLSFLQEVPPSGGGDMTFRSVFNKSFKYRNAQSTDIRLTFQRIRREQRLQEQRAQSGDGDHSAKVIATIGRRDTLAAK